MGEEKVEASASCSARIIRYLNYITVEPVVFGSLIIVYMISMLGKQYIFYRLALDYNLTKTSFETSCNETAADETDPEYILFQRVSAETSIWLTYLSVAIVVPSTFTTIALGSWSDKFGRKFPLLLTLLGFLALILSLLIVILLEAPVPYLLIGCVLCGLLGDAANLFSCSYAHITDITKPQHRTFRISVIETCVGMAGIVASISGGVWLDRKGFLPPVWFMLGIGIADFLYVLVRFDSSNEKWYRNLKYLFSKEPFKHIYEVMKPRRENKSRHTSIILYLFAFFLLAIATYGIGIILVVYVIGLPFCWNPVQVGISLSIGKLGFFLVLAIVKIFSDIRSENKLIAVGLISNAASCFVLAFAVDDWMIYLGLVVQMVYVLPSPIIRSQMSRLVSPDEVGPVFALQASTENLSIMFASALFNGVLGATVDSSLPGAAFLLSPMLIMIFLPVFRLAYAKARQAHFNEITDSKIQVEDKL